MTKQEEIRELVFNRILKQFEADHIPFTIIGWINVDAMTDNILNDLALQGVVISVPCQDKSWGIRTYMLDEPLIGVAV